MDTTGADADAAMIIRSLREDEIHRVVDFPVDPALRTVTADAVRADFAAHRMRPEWSWVIEHDGHLLGRALWWGRADSTQPLSLDALDLTPGLDAPARLASRLLTAGSAAVLDHPGDRPPEHTLRLPRGWRERADVAAAVGWRIEAARAVGLTESNERLQYAWTPADGLSAPDHRLGFRAGTDAEFLDLFVEVAHGSLDVGTVRGLQTLGAQAQARDDLEFYLSCPGDRAWWAIASDPEGHTVGFAIPSATPSHRNVGFLGVLPAHRGHGYVDALLDHITRVHAGSGATLVTATTDITNAPMAAAFARAHYQVTEVRLVLEAPLVGPPE